MNKVFSAIAAAVVGLGIVGGGVGSGVIPNPIQKEEPFRVYSNPGGEIFSFMDAWHQFRVSERKVEIRGVCASACTFFLGMLPKSQVCYDEWALLGFHGVYSGGFMAPPKFNQVMTEWTYNYVYSDEVIKKLNELGWSVYYDINPEENPTGLIWQGPDFMKELGYEVCE